MFEFYGDVMGGEEVGGGVEDAGEFTGFDAVVVVVGEPDLEDTGLFGVGFPAAVDEGF